MHNTFVNEALVDFTQPVNQEKMRVALQAVAESLGQEYPLVIGGQRVWTEEKIASYNPSQRIKWWDMSPKRRLTMLNWR